MLKSAFALLFLISISSSAYAVWNGRDITSLKSRILFLNNSENEPIKRISTSLSAHQDLGEMDQIEEGTHGAVVLHFRTQAECMAFRDLVNQAILNGNQNLRAHYPVPAQCRLHLENYTFRQAENLALDQGQKLCAFLDFTNQNHPLPPEVLETLKWAVSPLE